MVCKGALGKLGVVETGVVAFWFAECLRVWHDLLA